MNLTPQQQKKLEKIKKLLDGGNVGIITYLLDLEDKLENDLPTITNLISKLKGDKGDNYTITQSDIESIASQARDLLNDDDIAEQVLNRLSLKEIAKIASSFIDVPKPKEIDVKKLKTVLKQEILDELPKPIPGENGKDADEEAIVEKIEKDLEEDLPQFGTQFRDGLEILQGDERLDKKAIKGLDDYEEVSRLAKEKTRVIGGGKQNLYQLNDVNIQSPTNNQVLKYNSTTSLWENGTGGGGGLDSFTSPDSTISIGGTLTDPTIDINLSHANTWTAEQGNTSIFRNNAGVDWSTNNVTLAAAGTDGGGAWIGFQWNHTDSKVYLQDELGVLFDLGVDTLYANDSIVSNQITANQFIGSTFTAVGSGGMLFESNSGTDVALFGAGGGSGATFYGGVNIAGNLTVDTNVLFVDTTNNRVGIGTATPNNKLTLVSAAQTPTNSTIANSADLGLYDSTISRMIIVGGSQADVFLDNAGATANLRQSQILNDNGKTSILSYSDVGAITNYLFVGNHSTGSVGIGELNPTARLQVKSSTSGSGSNAFQIYSAGSALRVSYRDDGRLWLGTGTPSYNALLTLDTSGTQTEIQFTTNATGRTSTDGAYLMYSDSIGFRYLNMETKPHVFYIGGSEVARFSETGAVMQITGTLAAQYTGGGSSRGGTISVVSSAGTPQDWYMAVAGTDNSVVNGRSWFLYDNTNSVARFFVDTSSRVGVGLGTSAATAFVDIAASTSAIAQLRMRAGVAVSAPNDGELWYENTNDRLMFRKNTTSSEVVSASTVTTEVVTSDTTLTITYNGVTYKLLAKA